MHETRSEMKGVDAGWRVVLMIWGAILASLGVYLVVCLSVGKSLQINISSDFSFKTIKYALFGVSYITLFLVYYLRKFLMNPGRSIPNSKQISSTQHPAIAKYTIAIVITSALLESIGIYGVILFLLAKDTSSLYQLLLISAVGMIYYRPRKEELIKIASHMGNHGEK